MKVAWLLLALIHAAPAAVPFVPGAVTRLYGVSPAGDVGVLLIHRGALFVAIVALCLFALFDPTVRRAASVTVAISVLGFLGVYARAGMPAGPLRSIALADVVAVAPLAVVLTGAWRA